MKDSIRYALSRVRDNEPLSTWQAERLDGVVSRDVVEAVRCKRMSLGEAAQYTDARFAGDTGTCKRLARLFAEHDPDCGFVTHELTPADCVCQGLRCDACRTPAQVAGLCDDCQDDSALARDRAAEHCDDIVNPNKGST